MRERGREGSERERGREKEREREREDLGTRGGRRRRRERERERKGNDAFRAERAFLEISRGKFPFPLSSLYITTFSSLDRKEKKKKKGKKKVTL